MVPPAGGGDAAPALQAYFYRPLRGADVFAHTAFLPGRRSNPQVHIRVPPPKDPDPPLLRCLLAFLRFLSREERNTLFFPDYVGKRQKSVGNLACEWLERTPVPIFEGVSLVCRIVLCPSTKSFVFSVRLPADPEERASPKSCNTATKHRRESVLGSGPHSEAHAPRRQFSFRTHFSELGQDRSSTSLFGTNETGSSPPTATQHTQLTGVVPDRGLREEHSVFSRPDTDALYWSARCSAVDAVYKGTQPSKTPTHTRLAGVSERNLPLPPTQQEPCG